jgi:hypothetical protein
MPSFFIRVPGRVNHGPLDVDAVSGVHVAVSRDTTEVEAFICRFGSSSSGV